MKELKDAIDNAKQAVLVLAFMPGRAEQPQILDNSQVPV